MRAPPPAFFLVSGCLLAAAEVGLRAWQAHGLSASLDAEGLRLFDTARAHQFHAALGLIVCGLLTRIGAGKPAGFGGCAFLAGALLFSGDLYAAAFRAGHANFGIAPVGGTLTILAWILLAAGAWMRGKDGAGTQIRTGG